MLADTLYDTTKSVRWGIPILFPNAGFLTDEQKGESWWNLPQHGFARTNEWRLIAADSVIPWCPSRESMDQKIDFTLKGYSRRLQKLGNDEQEADSSFGMTKKDNIFIQSLSSSDISDMFGYEWQGNIENTITIFDDSIELRYSIANNSDKELPISWGLHPYWNIPLWDKSQIQWGFAWGDIIASDIDNWSRGGTTRIDIPDDGIVSFTIPWVGTIELQLSPKFRRLWIWSLPDRDFVCIEPVMWDDGNILQNPILIPAWEKSESAVRVRVFDRNN